MYVVVVGWLLLSPGAPGGPGVGWFDKVGHVVLGLGLGVLVWASTAGAAVRLRVAVVVAAGVVFAGATEWLQGYVPERTPDVWDAVADVTGTLMALGFLAVAQRRTRTRHS